MTHRTFDWKPRFDEASRAYPIRTAIGHVEERQKFWETGAVLDQGAEGACVGFGWTGELLASPRPATTPAATGNAFARMIYRRAQAIDEWEGENYEGTSVLAGAKIVQQSGFIGSYRWCFSIEDVRDAIIAEGPVVIGINWYDSMYDTRPSGLVEIGGNIVGGHCILLTGYHPGMRIKGEGWFARHRVFKWRNSWGPSYGVGGSGLIKYDDLAALLADNGEACVPMERKQVKIG